MVTKAYRHVGAVTLAVVLVMLLASFGFNALSINPTIPADTTIRITDAPEPIALNERGENSLVTITHAGGEPIPLEELTVVVGDRSSGLEFGVATNWTATKLGVTFALAMNDEPIAEPVGSEATFEEGETLTVQKTDGTYVGSGRFNVTVRLFHRPSQTVLAKERVQMR